MDELIKALLPQFPMVAVILGIFWVLRRDALDVFARMEGRLDRLIDALIDDDQSD